MRILLIKLSSLGDVVHNFPVAHDISHAFPHAQIDWCVDAPFAALVALHPAIHQVIPIRLRALKNAWWSPRAWSNLFDDKATLTRSTYDHVIDTQGLLKSAIVAGWTNGVVSGFDRASAREPIAARMVTRAFSVAKNQHAVTRNRALAAAALGYAIPADCDYGMSTTTPTPRAERRVFFLHGTSRDDKSWPMHAWISLAQALSARGFCITILSGSAAEFARSQAIVAAMPHAQTDVQAMPMRPLAETAALLAQAHAVVGVDTGLAHLAVALGRPTVGIYLTTDPARTGLFAATGVACENVVGVRGGSRDNPGEVSVAAVLAAFDRITK